MQIAILGATSHIAKDLIRSFVKEPSMYLWLYARRPEAVQAWLSGLPHAHCQVGTFDDFRTAPTDLDAIVNFVGVGNPAQAAAMGAAIFEVTEEFDDLALAHLQRQPGCRYIFASSGAAYGGDFTQPVDETTPAVVPINRLQPSDWYGAAKLHAECRHRSLSGLPIVDIRIFNYFSSSEDIEARFLITDMLRAIRNRDIFQTSAANMTRDYAGPQEVDQLVKRILAAPAVNAAVDCYTKAPIDKLSMLKAMQSEFGLRYELIAQRTGLAATGNKIHYYSNSRKANELFGYAPTGSALDIVLEQATQLLANTEA